MNTALQSFCGALRVAGLVYDGEIIGDGELHRFKAAGDRKEDSWYVLHVGTPAAGAFGCWKRGIKEKWCEKRRESFTDAEWQTIREKWKRAEAERERAETERHKKAQKVVAWILERAKLAQSHPYLERKGVNNYDDVREYRGALVLPLRDANGELHSLQFIGGDGTKRFLGDGRIQGCFFTLADKQDGALVICEGYATGASIFEASGFAVVCAMNCGNLLAVSKALREKFPQREIIIAGDNDQFTDGNPGLTKATEAAKTIHAKLAVPQFKDISTKPTDFNDAHQLEGLDTVKTQIENATPPKESDEDIIIRLAALPPLEYERHREDAANKLGCRTGILDKLVDAKRPKKADAEFQGGALEPWDDVVDGAALLDELRATYRRFMVLPSQADVLNAVWTLHTYLFDCFSYTPYLHVTSPEKECGKSTLGELMNHLCANATTPGGMSAASMFRRIERVKPTLLLDEWDTLSDENRQAALNVLNTGFKWNGVYTICVGDDHEDRDFHTFCPKAIFGLSEKKLPDTTRSRCFLLTLQKKLPSELVEKLTRKFDGSILRRKCLRWANDHREKLKKSEPVMPPGLSAREEDISEPLLAIADGCGGEWPDLMRQCVLHFFEAVQAEDGSIGVELLKDFRLAFDNSDRLSSEAAKEYFNGLEDRPWGGWNESKGIAKRQIAAKLRAYKIHPRDVWLNGKTVKGYFREQFEEAFCRYLLPDPASIREAARAPKNIERNEVLPSASDASPCGLEKAIPANDDAAPRGLADEKPVDAEKQLVEADLL